MELTNRSRNTQHAEIDPNGPVSMWVVLAIGVQVLVSSMSLAATTCGETLERTRVTRISGPMVQAIRELAQQSERREPARVIEHELVEEPREMLPSGVVDNRPDTLVGVLWTALPPPARC